MSERKQLCVYTHSANGKVFYVGQGTRFRPSGRGSRSQAWKAHVRNAGGYDINIVHWTDDRDEAVRIESELIAAYPSACNFEKHDRRTFPKAVAIDTAKIKLSPLQIAAVDDWRRNRPDIPPRAVAIVQLMEIGLESAEKKKKAKPEKRNKD
jgi:hypothetical protein